ncbi:hypothetical protein B484DRAFT_390956 [Ochromonadaceae sp. CCMP2298]|nr:hypothetical protein B484DRAFT_390956 [Ochromonadaceae sp. CCMP2298]
MEDEDDYDDEFEHDDEPVLSQQLKLNLTARSVDSVEDDQQISTFQVEAEPSSPEQSIIDGVEPHRPEAYHQSQEPVAEVSDQPGLTAATSPVPTRVRERLLEVGEDIAPVSAAKTPMFKTAQHSDSIGTEKRQDSRASRTASSQHYDDDDFEEEEHRGAGGEEEVVVGKVGEVGEVGPALHGTGGGPESHIHSELPGHVAVAVEVEVDKLGTQGVKDRRKIALRQLNQQKQEPGQQGNQGGQGPKENEVTAKQASPQHSPQRATLSSKQASPTQLKPIAGAGVGPAGVGPGAGPGPGARREEIDAELASLGLSPLKAPARTVRPSVAFEEPPKERKNRLTFSNVGTLGREPTQTQVEGGRRVSTKPMIPTRKSLHLPRRQLTPGEPAGDGAGEEDVVGSLGMAPAVVWLGTGVGAGVSGVPARKVRYEGSLQDRGSNIGSNIGSTYSTLLGDGEYLVDIASTSTVVLSPSRREGAGGSGAAFEPSYVDDEHLVLPAVRRRRKPPPVRVAGVRVRQPPRPRYHYSNNPQLLKSAREKSKRWTADPAHKYSEDTGMFSSFEGDVGRESRKESARLNQARREEEAEAVREAARYNLAQRRSANEVDVVAQARMFQQVQATREDRWEAQQAQQRLVAIQAIQQREEYRQKLELLSELTAHSKNKYMRYGANVMGPPPPSAKLIVAYLQAQQKPAPLPTSPLSPKHGNGGNGHGHGGNGGYGGPGCILEGGAMGRGREEEGEGGAEVGVRWGQPSETGHSGDSVASAPSVTPSAHSTHTGLKAQGKGGGGVGGDGGGVVGYGGGGGSHLASESLESLGASPTHFSSPLHPLHPLHPPLLSVPSDLKVDLFGDPIDIPSLQCQLDAANKSALSAHSSLEELLAGELLLGQGNLGQGQGNVGLGQGQGNMGTGSFDSEDVASVAGMASVVGFPSYQSVQSMLGIDEADAYNILISSFYPDTDNPHPDESQAKGDAQSHAHNTHAQTNTHAQPNPHLHILAHAHARTAHEVTLDDVFQHGAAGLPDEVWEPLRDEDEDQEQAKAQQEYDPYGQGAEQGAGAPVGLGLLGVGVVQKEDVRAASEDSGKYGIYSQFDEEESPTQSHTGIAYHHHSATTTVLSPTATAAAITTAAATALTGTGTYSDDYEDDFEGSRNDSNADSKTPSRAPTATLLPLDASNHRSRSGTGRGSRGGSRGSRGSRGGSRAGSRGRRLSAGGLKESTHKGDSDAESDQYDNEFEEFEDVEEGQEQEEKGGEGEEKEEKEGAKEGEYAGEREDEGVLDRIADAYAYAEADAHAEMSAEDRGEERDEDREEATRAGPGAGIGAEAGAGASNADGTHATDPTEAGEWDGEGGGDEGGGEGGEGRGGSGDRSGGGGGGGVDAPGSVHSADLSLSLSRTHSALVLAPPTDSSLSTPLFPSPYTPSHPTLSPNPHPMPSSPFPGLGDNMGEHNSMYVSQGSIYEQASPTQRGAGVAGTEGGVETGVVEGVEGGAGAGDADGGVASPLRIGFADTTTDADSVYSGGKASVKGTGWDEGDKGNKGNGDGDGDGDEYGEYGDYDDEFDSPTHSPDRVQREHDWQGEWGDGAAGIDYDIGVRKDNSVLFYNEGEETKPPPFELEEGSPVRLHRKEMDLEWVREGVREGGEREKHAYDEAEVGDEEEGDGLSFNQVEHTHLPSHTPSVQVPPIHPTNPAPTTHLSVEQQQCVEQWEQQNQPEEEPQNPSKEQAPERDQYEDEFEFENDPYDFQPSAPSPSHSVPSASLPQEGAVKVAVAATAAAVSPTTTYEKNEKNRHRLSHSPDKEQTQEQTGQQTETERKTDMPRLERLPSIFGAPAPDPAPASAVASVLATEDDEEEDAEYDWGAADEVRGAEHSPVREGRVVPVPLAVPSAVPAPDLYGNAKPVHQQQGGEQTQGLEGQEEEQEEQQELSTSGSDSGSKSKRKGRKSHRHRRGKSGEGVSEEAPLSPLVQSVREEPELEAEGAEEETEGAKEETEGAEEGAEDGASKYSPSPRHLQKRKSHHSSRRHSSRHSGTGSHSSSRHSGSGSDISDEEGQTDVKGEKGEKMVQEVGTPLEVLHEALLYRDEEETASMHAPAEVQEAEEEAEEEAEDVTSAKNSASPNPRPHLQKHKSHHSHRRHSSRHDGSHSHSGTGSHHSKNSSHSSSRGFVDDLEEGDTVGVKAVKGAGVLEVMHESGGESGAVQEEERETETDSPGGGRGDKKKHKKHKKDKQEKDKHRHHRSNDGGGGGADGGGGGGDDGMEDLDFDF